MKSVAVVIIGGGPAGCTAAIALRKQGVQDVLVLEAGCYEKFVIGESIPPSAKKVFNQLEIYHDFLQEAHLPCYGTCSHWGDDRKGFNDTILSPYGHGWHLDRRRYNLFLSRKAVESGVEVQCKATFLGAEIKADGTRVIEFLQDDQRKTVSAQFVIDASGAKSVFATIQGSRQEKGIPLLCLTRRFKISPEDTVSSLTRIEAVQNGWWYGAKLPNNELLVAFYTDQETLKETKMQLADVWMKALYQTKSIHESIREENAMSASVKGFPAHSFCLDQVAGKDWLALGDAASSYDPITSRGIYKSMTDALVAAEGIAAYLRGENLDLTPFDTYVKSNYQAYLLERAHYYQLEQRWKNEAFWKKFHGLTLQRNQSVSLTPVS